MGWEYIKERSNEAFRRLTGVQKPTFEKMIVVLERSTVIFLSNPVFGSEQALSDWLTQGYQGLQKIHAKTNYPRKSPGSDNWQSKKGKQTRPSLVSGHSMRTSWVGLNVSKSFRINIQTGINALDRGLIWLPVFTTLSRWAELLNEL